MIENEQVENRKIYLNRYHTQIFLIIHKLIQY